MPGTPRRGRRSRRVLRGAFLAASAAALTALAWGCVARPVCASEGGCVASSSESPAPLAQTRRLLYEPVDLAYVRRGSGALGTPVLATLGASDGSLLLLRFSIDLPPEPRIVEAFILLDQAMTVDADPTPIALHASRITQPWDGRSVSFATRPHLEDFHGPATLVRPGAGAQVRVGVRDLVRRWHRRDRDELGVALLVEGSSPGGVAVALVPTSGPADPGGRAAYAGPRLELYVK